MVRQLNVKLSQAQHDALRRYAARRRTPVAWLIKDYITSLVERERAQAVGAHEPTQLAAHGGAFDWLADEPDIYTDEDDEPIGEGHQARVRRLRRKRR